MTDTEIDKEYLDEAFIERINNTENDSLSSLINILLQNYDTEYSYIFQMSHTLLRHGYIPVIAHVERYGCLVKTPKRLEELQEIGAFIQMNAGAVIGEEGWSSKNFCKKALKQGWVDVIASDSHGIKKRVCYMEDTYDYIREKYGEKLAHRLMIKNPKKIIGE